MPERDDRIAPRPQVVLGLAEGEEAVIVLSFGYPSKPRDPAGRSAEDWVAAANRRPFDEVVSRR